MKCKNEQQNRKRIAIVFCIKNIIAIHKNKQPPNSHLYLLPMVQLMMYCLVILDCIAKALVIILCTIGECFNTCSCWFFCTKIASEGYFHFLSAEKLESCKWIATCMTTCLWLQLFPYRVFFCDFFYNVFSVAIFFKSCIFLQLFL